MQCGAIESGRRGAFKPAVLNAGHISSRYFNRNAESFYIASHRPVNPSADVVTPPFAFIPEKEREVRLKARTKPGLLNKCLPFFRVSELALLYRAVHGVNKRTSADKGPTKISPRGPFRGNQREFANSFFFRPRD